MELLYILIMFFLFLLFINTLKNLIRCIKRKKNNKTHTKIYNNKNKERKYVTFADDNDKPLEILIEPLNY